MSEEARRRLRHCRAYLENKLQNSEELHYGINTGFGSLCNIRISDQDIEQLQHNLMVSHAAGMGDPVPEEIVRLMLLLKAQSLCYGHSGIREELVERLLDFFQC